MSSFRIRINIFRGDLTDVSVRVLSLFFPQAHILLLQVRLVEWCGIWVSSHAHMHLVVFVFLPMYPYIVTPRMIYFNFINLWLQDQSIQILSYLGLKQIFGALLSQLFFSASNLTSSPVICHQTFMFLGYCDPVHIHFCSRNINIFWGDLTNISANTSANTMLWVMATSYPRACKLNPFWFLHLIFHVNLVRGNMELSRQRENARLLNQSWLYFVVKLYFPLWYRLMYKYSISPEFRAKYGHHTKSESAVTCSLLSSTSRTSLLRIFSETKHTSSGTAIRCDFLFKSVFNRLRIIWSWKYWFWYST